MELEDKTNSVEVEVTADANLAATQEVETGDQTAELVENEKPIETETEDEELELGDGLKLRVPKEQAQRVRDGWLRQSDYTKKTQELAEARKAFEADRRTLTEASEAELGAYALATSHGAQVKALDERAATFGGWTAWVRSDASSAYEAYITRTELERVRQDAMGKLAQFRQQRATNEQQESAKRVGEAAAILEREIGWNATKAAQLLEGGAREYQFERSELDRFDDARIVLALHDALQWRAHQKKEQAAVRHQTAQAARPAATVQARSAPPTGLDDRLPADEWVRRRNQQLQKRG